MLSTVKRLIPVTIAVLAGPALLAGCGGDEQVTSFDAVASVKVLYRSESQNSINVFGSLKEQLARAGVEAIAVPVANAAYTDILTDGAAAERGTWDIAIAGRTGSAGGDDAASIIEPLFNGEEAYPPRGSNFGRYDNRTVSGLIDQASAATAEQAVDLWNRVDRAVLEDAAIYPIAEPQQANYASELIAHRAYVPAFQNYDPITLTKKNTGRAAMSEADKTLHLLGSGDVDTMDPNLSYYSIGYLGLRMWSRQLYAFPAVHAQPAPDLAAGPPVVSQVPGPEGSAVSKVTVRLVRGARWDNGRAVVPEDVVRGVKRSCNPVHPFPGLDRYLDLIEGLSGFCAQLTALGSDANASDIKAVIEGHKISGILSDPSANTVTLTLTRPDVSVAAVTSLLTLSAFRAAPIEYLNDLPGSLSVPNMISNGPYRVETYDPDSQIGFIRNRAWDESVRKRHFTRIHVDETLSQARTQQQLQAGSPKADMEWDDFVPVAAVPSLVRDSNLTIRPTLSLDPYLVFNTVSPNNDSALSRPEVRRALSTAISRTALVAALGGKPLHRALTHVLPDSISGVQRFDLYAYNPELAKATLADLLNR